jgi:hypothetical protein
VAIGSASSTGIAPRDVVRERRALDQLHDDRTEGCRPRIRRGRLFHPVDGGDVLVGERGENLGLALEPGHALGVGGHLVRQNLQRHLALQPPVPRAIHLPHPALADQAEDGEGADLRAGADAHTRLLVPAAGRRPGHSTRNPIALEPAGRETGLPPFEKGLSPFPRGRRAPSFLQRNGKRPPTRPSV